MKAGRKTLVTAEVKVRLQHPLLKKDVSKVIEKTLIMDEHFSETALEPHPITIQEPHPKTIQKPHPKTIQEPPKAVENPSKPVTVADKATKAPVETAAHEEEETEEEYLNK